MHNDFARIAVAFMTTALPLMAIFGAISFKRWLRFQERKLELDAAATSERLKLDDGRSARLEQRVAVLERILTDRSDRLAAEIDRLRDAPLN